MSAIQQVTHGRPRLILSIAAGLFGMPMAVALRVGLNVFSAFYTVICNKVIDRLTDACGERKDAEA